MSTLESILASIASIFSVFKRNEKIVEERAEKMDIKNRVRAKKAERKIKRIDKRISKK